MKTNDKEKAPINAASFVEAKGFEAEAITSQEHYNTTEENKQERFSAMLKSIIPIGRENAIKAPKLADKLGLTVRETTQLIHDERARGAIILADFSSHGGFFFPSPGARGKIEISEFVKSMDRRAKQIFIAAKSARAFLKGDDPIGKA